MMYLSANPLALSRGDILLTFLLLGDSRKYPYHTTDGFHVLNPPCLRKFQNALPPHALRIP